MVFARMIMYARGICDINYTEVSGWLSISFTKSEWKASGERHMECLVQRDSRPLDFSIAADLTLYLGKHRVVKYERWQVWIPAGDSERANNPSSSYRSQDVLRFSFMWIQSS